MLSTLRIDDCPCMDIFTSGSLITPELRQVTQLFKNYDCKDNLGEVIGQDHLKKVSIHILFFSLFYIIDF